MKIKQMIYILVAIIAAFVISGYSSLHEMSTRYSTAYIQTKSATSEIGLSFDWYGLTFIDTAVKYANGMISAEDAEHTLRNGAEENARLLYQYYQNTLPEEAEEADYIRSQDAVVVKLFNKVLEHLAKNDRNAIQQMLPQIYNVVDPLCEKINRIIEIKTASALSAKGELSDNIDELKRFFFISFALCLSLCIGMAIRE
jgi:hypothetical protein